METLRRIAQWFGECLAALADDDDPFIDRRRREADDKQKKWLTYLGSPPER